MVDFEPIGKALHDFTDDKHRKIFILEKKGCNHRIDIS